MISAGRTRIAGIVRTVSWLVVSGFIVWGTAFIVRVPAVGVADRGDYYRVARPAGIHVDPPRDLGGAHPPLERLFRVAPAKHRGGATSASVVASLARRLPLFAPDGLFDLRQLGVLYYSLVLAIVGATFACGISALAGVAVLAALFEPGYLAYFNSLYSEAPALVAVFGLILWLAAFGDLGATFWTAADSRDNGRNAALTFLLFLGAFSRLPMLAAPLIVLALFAGSWVLEARPTPSLGRAAWLFAMLAAVVLPTLHFTVGRGPRFPKINAFHAVYLGPAALSDDPARVLERLDLPASSVDLVGKSYFDAKPSPAVERAALSVSLPRRAWAYVEEPRALRRVAARIASHLATYSTEPDHESTDNAASELVAFKFSAVRKAIFGPVPSLIWGALGSMLAVAVASVRGRFASIVPPSAYLFIVAFVASQIVISVLGDGLFSLGRHLVVARFAFDAGFALLIAEALSHVLRRVATRAENSALRRSREPA